MTLYCNVFYNALGARGIGFYAGVPDSLLASYCAYVSDHTSASQHVITANEGSAIAVAAGRYLATGEIGVVYLQNSGLGNIINPLASLACSEVYGVPILLLIGWRGEPGQKDEPQHVKMGRISGQMLDVVGIPHAILPERQESAEKVLDMAIASMRERSSPYALLIPKGTFASYTLQNAREQMYELSRERAIEIILDGIEENAAVVSTTGKSSRELFEIRERRNQSHESDFLTVGSMGHCSQVALGVALAQPERPVYCIDGDGAAIMHMGGLSTIGALKPKNFRHIVLNNGAHDSVGGQPTVAHIVDLCAIASGCKYQVTLRGDTAEELRRQLLELRHIEGPGLLEVRIHRGARADLGRPTRTPRDTKHGFMAFLNGSA